MNQDVNKFMRVIYHLDRPDNPLIQVSTIEPFLRHFPTLYIKLLAHDAVHQGFVEYAKEEDMTMWENTYFILTNKGREYVEKELLRRD